MPVSFCGYGHVNSSQYSVPEPSVDMGMLIVLNTVPEPSVDMSMLIVLNTVPEPSVDMGMLIVLNTLCLNLLWIWAC